MGGRNETIQRVRASMALRGVVNDWDRSCEFGLLTLVEAILTLWCCRSLAMVRSPFMMQQLLQGRDKYVSLLGADWVVVEERYVHVAIAHRELASVGELNSIHLNNDST